MGRRTTGQRERRAAKKAIKLNGNKEKEGGREGKSKLRTSKQQRAQHRRNAKNSLDRYSLSFVKVSPPSTDSPLARDRKVLPFLVENADKTTPLCVLCV